MVKGEQVRVAGANVGKIESVDVTDAGRDRSLRERQAGRRSRARRCIVMKITDPGFQDFRQRRQLP